MQREPDMAQLLKIARSPAGQQLLSLLQSSGANTQQTAALAAQGQYDQAKSTLSHLLSQPEYQKLLKQLEEQL